MRTQAKRAGGLASRALEMETPLRRLMSSVASNAKSAGQASDARVAVLGLGTIGHSVAQVFAQAGCEVRCFSPSANTRNLLHPRVRSNLRQLAAADLVPSTEAYADSVLQCLSVFTTEEEAVTGADFVWEAAPEVLTMKQELLSRVETSVSEDTIIVSTTSSFPMTLMASDMIVPGRAIVGHPFNPPHLIPIVEVVPGALTTPETTAALTYLLRSAGKQPIHIEKEVPGFVVNRIQLALLREAWAILDSGIASAEDIDAAVKGTLGLRMASMGPLRIADFAGLDTWERIFHSLANDLDNSTSSTPAALQRLISNGHFGAKTGQGFYSYEHGELEMQLQERDRGFAETVKSFHTPSRSNKR